MFLEEDVIVSPDFYLSALAVANITTMRTNGGEKNWGFSLYSSHTEVLYFAHHVYIAQEMPTNAISTGI